MAPLAFDGSGFTDRVRVRHSSSLFERLACEPTRAHWCAALNTARPFGYLPVCRDAA